MKLDWDLVDWLEAITLYQDATKKDLAEVLNKRRNNILWRSRHSILKTTPKADKATISKELNKTNARGSKLLAALAAKELGKGHTKPQLRKRMRRIVSKRNQSIGYAKSWGIAAARKHGGRAGKKRHKESDLGSATTATPDNLVITLKGFIRKGIAEGVSEPALIKTIRLDAADMKKFAEDKLAKTSRKYSGR